MPMTKKCPGEDFETLVNERSQPLGAHDDLAEDLGFHLLIKAGVARAEGDAAQDTIECFLGQAAVGGAEDPQNGEDDKGDDTKHGLKNLSDFYQMVDQELRFFKRVVNVSRGTHRAGDAAGVEPGVHAMLTGTAHDAAHLVEHQRDAVRINTFDVKGGDAAAQSRVCGTDELEPGDGADSRGDGLVELQFVLLDGVEADLLQVFHRSAEADDAGVILQASLELLGRGQEVSALVGGAGDRVAADHEGFHLLQQLVLGVEHARAGRSHQLVPGESQEVDVQ